MNQVDELTRILGSLGATADAVAVTLRGAQISGVRNTVRFLNPVVRYCQAQLRLDNYALDLTQGNQLRMVLPDGTRVLALLPASVKNFLDAFHHGAYPDLELPLS